MQASIRPTPASSGPNSPTPLVAPGPLFDGPPALETRLEGGSRRGRVTVSLAPVPRAVDGGWDAVYGTTWCNAAAETISAQAGFPALLARVEPEGRGYHNWLGWIQLVNERDPTGGSVSSEHDPIWFLRGKEVPYGAVGYAPTFFDAPTRPARRAVLWEADLFLCTVPSISAIDGGADSPIEPLAGLRWGFRIESDGGEPTPIPPRWTGDWAWASWVPVLRRAFPTWRFADRTPSVVLPSSR
ncbi:MAG: hypothetical protein L3J92_05785 [Thermoplasmata archaeon]|jgi:hypothetical protein|nr:hypothetical protein [Thermoplasmata archaeon]